MKALPLLLLMAAPLGVHAQLTFTTNNSAITITGYNGSPGIVVIPSATNSHPVTSIKTAAFDNKTTLTSVTIPNSVTNIGSYPFARCSSLTAITVDVNNPAYSSLAGVLFDKNQTTLIEYPMGGAHSYAIPNTVTSIGDHAFTYCSSLGSVTIPDSVASIENYAFIFCSSLANIPIGSSVTNVGNYAFLNCSSLTAINVSANNPVYSSLAGVLFNKSQTTLIQYPTGGFGTYTIPNTVSNIGEFAFYDRMNLSSVTIPDSVTNIAQEAFGYCIYLTTATIGSNVTTIGNYAFQSCPFLTTVYFHGSAPSIDAGVFDTDNATVYYLPGTTGWDTTFGGLPAVLWNPQATTFIADGTQFGFNITGPTNATIVVVACTDLANPVWLPVSTNTLSSDGTSFFSDPQWANYPARFYRFRSP